MKDALKFKDFQVKYKYYYLTRVLMTWSCKTAGMYMSKKVLVYTGSWRRILDVRGFSFSAESATRALYVTTHRVTHGFLQINIMVYMKQKHFVILQARACNEAQKDVSSLRL